MDLLAVQNRLLDIVDDVMLVSVQFDVEIITKFGSLETRGVDGPMQDLSVRI